jgi:plastocyanin
MSIKYLHRTPIGIMLATVLLAITLSVYIYTAIPHVLAQNKVIIHIAKGASSPFNAKFYDQSSITIGKGTTVSWINDDTVLHTVTSGDFASGPSGVFNSGPLVTGQTFEYIFNKPGKYTYYCTIFPHMKGVVIVTQ